MLREWIDPRIPGQTPGRPHPMGRRPRREGVVKQGEPRPTSVWVRLRARSFDETRAEAAVSTAKLMQMAG